MAGKCEWVWVDCFTKLPLTREVYAQLKKHFKICLVSPELLGRPSEIGWYREQLAGMEIDAVCTDQGRDWQ
jgi:tripartite-type tricarboxylate transporter receptor subunit TctC